MTNTDKPKQAPEAINPRYAGATPKQVVAALMRPVDKPKSSDDSKKKR